MITDTLKALAIARQNLEHAKRTTVAAEEAYKGTNEFFHYVNTRAQQDIVEATVKDLESTTRAEALELYAKDQNRQPTPEIFVGIYHVPNYYGEEVLAWARINAVHLLELDKKRFEHALLEGILLGSGCPGKVITEPRVRISSDLSDYLKEEATSGDYEEALDACGLPGGGAVGGQR